MSATMQKKPLNEVYFKLNEQRKSHFKGALNSCFKNMVSPGHVPENIAIVASYFTISLLFLFDVIVDQAIAFHVFYIFPLAFIALHSSRINVVTGAVASAISLQFIELLFFHGGTSEIPVFTFLFIVIANSMCALGVRYARDHMLEVKRLSTIDPLTQLNNRRGLDKVMMNTKGTRRQRRYDGHFSVVMLDLDGFKGLNDSMGHSVGDKALILFAAVLRNQLRQTDEIFRLGGDEFVIFMPNTEAIDCDSLCHALSQLVRTKLTDEFSYPMSTSIGFTTVENSTAISADILSVADRALYRAKAAGKGCVVRGYVEELTEIEKS